MLKRCGVFLFYLCDPSCSGKHHLKWDIPWYFSFEQQLCCCHLSVLKSNPCLCTYMYGTCMCLCQISTIFHHYPSCQLFTGIKLIRCHVNQRRFIRVIGVTLNLILWPVCMCGDQRFPLYPLIFVKKVRHTIAAHGQAFDGYNDRAPFKTRRALSPHIPFAQCMW